jgi:hypothetical protein
VRLGLQRFGLKTAAFLVFVLLQVAFCWAHKTGEWRHDRRAIKIKKHGRPEVSLFRYGLDYLVDALANLSYKYDAFIACMRHVFAAPPGIQTIGCLV